MDPQRDLTLADVIVKVHQDNPSGLLCFYALIAAISLASLAAGIWVLWGVGGGGKKGGAEGLGADGGPDYRGDKGLGKTLALARRLGALCGAGARWLGGMIGARGEHALRSGTMLALAIAALAAGSLVGVCACLSSFPATKVDRSREVNAMKNAMKEGGPVKDMAGAGGIAGGEPAVPPVHVSYNAMVEKYPFGGVVYTFRQSTGEFMLGKQVLGKGSSEIKTGRYKMSARKVNDQISTPRDYIVLARVLPSGESPKGEVLALLIPDDQLALPPLIRVPRNVWDAVVEHGGSVVDVVSP